MTPSALEPFVLFAGLDEDERRCFLDEMELVEATRGEVVFEEGESADGLMLLVSGSLSLATADDGARGGFGPGTAIGAHALVAPCARETTAESVDHSKLLFLSRTGFERVAEAQPRAALKLALAILGESAALVREAAHQLRI